MKPATTHKTTSRKNSAAVESEAVSLEGSAAGAIKIHEGVIASLARKAVLSTEGVSRLAGNALMDNIAEIVGSRRMQSRAIAVDLSEAGKVALEIKLNILIGHRLPVVAANVQRAVTSLVEDATGMTVTSVDVLVQDIDEKMPDEPETDVSEDEPEN